jgi:hypothetical protein
VTRENGELWRRDGGCLVPELNGNEDDEIIAAIREGISELEAGEGIPLEELRAEFVRRSSLFFSQSGRVPVIRENVISCLHAGVTREPALGVVNVPGLNVSVAASYSKTAYSHPSLSANLLLPSP